VTIEPQRSEFLQVASAIRAAIQAGKFPAGSQLPAEPELAARYGVSRATVNRALSMLRAEGLIKPARGRGTTVNALPPIRRSTTRRVSRQAREEGGAHGAFDGEITRLGLTPRTDVEVGQVPMPEDLAGYLDVPAGAPVLARARVMFANDVPVQVATSYLPLALAEGTAITEADTGPGGIYSRLADIGQEPVAFREITRVRPPDPEEARTLQLDADHRVYDLVRIARTGEGRAVEICRTVMPVHQWELDTEWRDE
jgi:GntR family transcriptional regulator